MMHHPCCSGLYIDDDQHHHHYHHRYGTVTNIITITTIIVTTTITIIMTNPIQVALVAAVAGEADPYTIGQVLAGQTNGGVLTSTTYHGGVKVGVTAKVFFSWEYSCPPIHTYIGSSDLK